MLSNTKKLFNKSNTISLVLHILILLALLLVKQANILVPSRSDGIEVAVIAPDDITEPAKTQNLIQAPTPVQVQNNPAEVNIKNTVVPKIKPLENKAQTPKPEIKPKTPPLPIKKTEKTKQKRTNPAAQLDSLLGQIKPPKNIGKSYGEAKGGNSRGSSNSNNLKNNYADEVIRLVRPYVSIPSDVSSDATAVVKVTILPNMHVYSVDLVRSSGNTQYDINVEQAIKRAAVFPDLPAGANWVDYRVLYLNFKPE